jgi:antitoxin component YwqK of YwqJK toxin-antitoxin module
MNRPIQLMVLAAALCAGCEFTPSNPGGPLNELETRGGRVYLKGDTQPYTGVHTQPLNVNGGKIVAGYKNGQFHGNMEEWYNIRQQFSNTEWDNGKLLNGTTWRPDGTVGSRVINGNGSMIRFSPEGSQIRETHYRNGVPMPPPTGSSAPSPPSPAPVKDASGLYVHPASGQPFHGPYKYIKDGCRHQGRMAQGQRDGLIRVWYPGCKPLMEADYSKGKINGRFVEWYPNGEQMVDAIFQRGRLVRATSWKLGGKVASELPQGTGTLVLFSPTGDPRRESVYNQGVKVTRHVQ